MNIPTDAKFLSDGLCYKKGVHDMVFAWINDEWKRSAKEWRDILKDKDKVALNGIDCLVILR